MFFNGNYKQPTVMVSSGQNTKLGWITFVKMFKLDYLYQPLHFKLIKKHLNWKEAKEYHLNYIKDLKTGKIKLDFRGD